MYGVMQCIRFVDCEEMRFSEVWRAGTVMSNLALTYSSAGRHADALAMGEMVLEFRRRVLPENHPDIGEGHLWSDALHVLC
jgi:hypothetical protein